MQKLVNSKYYSFAIKYTLQITANDYDEIQNYVLNKIMNIKYDKNFKSAQIFNFLKLKIYYYRNDYFSTKRGRVKNLFFNSDCINPEMTPGHYTPSSSVECDEAFEYLCKIFKPTELQKKIIDLIYYEGLSLPEIADRLGYKYNQVYFQIKSFYKENTDYINIWQEELTLHRNS